MPRAAFCVAWRTPEYTRDGKTALTRMYSDGTLLGGEGKGIILDGTPGKDAYHTVTTKGGSYCCFCYGTIYESSSKLERHSMVTEVLPQPANGRFAVVEKCSLCDYCCTRGWMTVLNACGPSSGIQRSKDAGMSTVATISRIPRSAAPSEPPRNC